MRRGELDISSIVSSTDADSLLAKLYKKYFGSVCPIKCKFGKVLERELREQLEDLI